MAYRRIGPTPWVSTSQPASVSIGRAAVADLDQLPAAARGVQRHRRAASGCRSSQRGQADGLAVGAAQRQVAAADRYAGTAPCPCCGRAGPRSGVTSKCRRSSVLSMPGGDVPAVVGGVGGLVATGAVVVDEPDEPGVLHAVALRRGGRPEHPLVQRHVGGEGRRRSWRRWSRRSCSSGRRAWWCGRAGRRAGGRATSLEVVVVEALGQGAQHGGGDLVVAVLVGQAGGEQVAPVPWRRPAGR